MRKAIKLGLLTVVASVILALPVTASAAISRNEPLPTTPRIEVINQVPQVITQVPLEMNNYLGTVNLLPEGKQSVIETLPDKFTDGVKSIEITGHLSGLVYAYTWDWYWGTDHKKRITFNSLGGATTVTVKVTNYHGEWGYFTVNVSPPEVDSLLGTVYLYPTKSGPDSFEITLPEFLKNDVSHLNPRGPLENSVQAEIINNGSTIKFSTSFMTKTTMTWRVVDHSYESGYYIINVIPKDYRIQPPLFINL